MQPYYIIFFFFFNIILLFNQFNALYMQRDTRLMIQKNKGTDYCLAQYLHYLEVRFTKGGVSVLDIFSMQSFPTSLFFRNPLTFFVSSHLFLALFFYVIFFLIYQILFNLSYYLISLIIFDVYTFFLCHLFCIYSVSLTICLYL